MTQSQNKPNNLAELDKKVADAKAAEAAQQPGPAHAPAQPQPDAVKA